MNYVLKFKRNIFANHWGRESERIAFFRENGNQAFCKIVVVYVQNIQLHETVAKAGKRKGCFCWEWGGTEMVVNTDNMCCGSNVTLTERRSNGTNWIVVSKSLKLDLTVWKFSLETCQSASGACWCPLPHHPARGCPWGTLVLAPGSRRSVASKADGAASPSVQRVTLGPVLAPHCCSN